MCVGIQVNPGDLVIADESGIVVVPFSLIEEVLIDLENAYKKEKEKEEAILKGDDI